MNLFLRRRLKTLVCFKPFNFLLRVMAPFLRRVVPLNKLNRVPILGTVSVCYSGWKPAQMHNNGSDSIATQIYWGGAMTYDLESIDLFLRLAQRSKVIFDIGAHTGIYSLVSAVNNPDAQIVAFEPVPNIRKVLEKSVALNDLPNLTIAEMAISDYVGKSEFHVPVDYAVFPTSASLNREFRNEISSIPVTVKTVDEFVRASAITRVDLMKIDTESTEHLVLAGAKQTIVKDRPIMVCEILAQQDPRSFTDMLSPHGYSYFWITPDGLYQKDIPSGDPHHVFLNYLLIPSEKIPLLNSMPVTVHPNKG